MAGTEEIENRSESVERWGVSAVQGIAKVCLWGFVKPGQGREPGQGRGLGSGWVEWSR